MEHYYELVRPLKLILTVFAVVGDCKASDNIVLPRMRGVGVTHVERARSRRTEPSN